MTAGGIESSFKNSRMQAIGSFLLLIALATGVFFQGTDSFLFLPCIGSALLLGIITLWPGIRNGWTLPGIAFPATVLIYGLYIWASIFWSSVPYNSTLFALIFSLFPFVFLISLLAQDRRRWLAVHLAAAGAGGAVLALWALIQFFILYDTYGPRIHHPMLNPNNLAALFNLCLFPALALYVQAKKPAHIAASFLLAMLYYGAMLVTQGRGALLAFAIAGVVFYLCVWRNSGAGWRKILLMAVGMGAFFLIVNGNLSGGLSDSLTRLPQDKHSMVERQLIWASTLEIVKTHFWGGTGLGTFTYYYPRYRSPQDMSDGYFTHMDPLQFWSEMGVGAPVLFYAILIGALVLTVRAVLRSAPGSADRLWLTGSFCALLTLAGHSHISFHLYMPVPLIVAGLLMAFWYDRACGVPGQEERLVRAPSGAPRFAVRALFLAMLVLPALWLGRAAAGVHYAGKAGVLMREGKPEEALRNIRLAQKIAPSSWDKPYDLHMRFCLDALGKGGVSPEERKRLYEEGLGYAAQARARNPAFTNVWNYQAMLHFSAYPDVDPHGRAKAIALLKEALEANPLLLDARIGLARIYSSKNEHRKALHVLTGGLDYPIPVAPSSLVLYNDIARIEAALGNNEGAERAMQKAGEFASRVRGRQQK